MSSELIILDWIQNHLRSGWMDQVMVWITALGDHGMIWIFAGLLLCLSRKYRKAGIWLLISLELGSIASNYMLKPLFMRPRPYEGLMIDLLIPAPGGYSFPSGHTTSSFAAASALVMAGNPAGIPALILAALIAFSRMYLYVHYPTDILGGVVVGTVCSAAVGWVIDKIGKWYKLKKERR